MKRSYSIESRCLAVISLLALCLFQANQIQGADKGAPLPDQRQIQQTQFVDRVKSSYQLAEHWLLHNMQDKGIFVYLYYPSQDRYSRKNNMIRQLMASRLLAEMSQTRPTLQPAHQKNLAFIFQHCYREDMQGRGYIYYNSKSKLGANAMALRTLVSSPFFDKYQDEAGRLADGIVSLMHTDGAFEPWFVGSVSWVFSVLTIIAIVCIMQIS